MTHSHVSRNSDRSLARSRRSRSPERRPSRRDATGRDGSRYRSGRSRSPHRVARPAQTSQNEESGADESKKLSMKERLALWKKRKEEKASDSGSEAARPESRASSVADEDTGSQFVTAPGSMTSDSHSTSDAVYESLPSTPVASNAHKQVDSTHNARVVQPVKIGLQLKPKPIKIGLGKPGLGGKRAAVRVKSSLSRSVFGPDADTDKDTDSVSSASGVRKLPSALPLLSADETDTVMEAAVPSDTAMDVDVAESDSLEEFMQSMDAQASSNHAGSNGGDADVVPDNDDGYGSDTVPADSEDVLALAAKRLKKKDLAAVDHSKMNYETFKRDFYIEPAELRNLTAEEVDMMRVDLGGIKIRGVNPPKPATSWSHFGLPAACADVIKHQGFEKPTPIQAQAVPAILSGRDMIGVAKTGSGKTLAFILPMLRHIKAQRPLAQGEGPIGLVMTPTRELAVQIHRECKPFLRPLGLRAVCAYGGSGIKDQIGELKRGCEIVVCTPGRFIDLLCANSGRVTNLHRVTYLVLDEADRMFDMGFEPQVTKIIQSVRPHRQTVLFSATFPRQMEALARKILRRPLEIVIGGRALIPPEVTQHVEVIEGKEKFVRLLGILGESFNSNSETMALIFVDRQEAADALLRDLMRRGYVCNSLHGGKDQTDRDQAIVDFKNRVFSVLIATSVAARGLDVRGLNVVINYDCPNHMEDLVHRVGRTGRAGNKGDAYTFITPDQDRFANEVVKAMKLSNLTPPENVQSLANAFLDKVRQGKERHGGKSGFGGKGLEKLDKDRSMMKKIQKVTYGTDDALDEDEQDQAEYDSDGEPVSAKVQPKASETVRRLDSAPNARRQNSTMSGQSPMSPTTVRPATPAADDMSASVRAAVLAAQAAARRLNISTSTGSQPSAALSAVDQINQQLGTTLSDGNKPRASSRETAQSIIANSSAVAAAAAATATGSSTAIPVGAFGCELDINDYPKKARWRATNRETLSQVIEQSGAAITMRGIYVPAGKPVPEGERKLYLSIEADTERAVEQAKNEIKRIITEATLHVMEHEARAGGTGRYTVV
ncbi:pre-mRNA processing RNA-helicase [Coemansia sp. RSA 1822]|nr:pre-mRNA processing RNA-helicase [Coemansia sp. RSA 638]KAJ2540358.1 pre-mRNA processing RNA-helicase [Coemansia sp. RSA 1853]KAJ2560582.1 pre-mRNA processing RNA-helicase [Coemansia sp. RSA 1822]